MATKRKPQTVQFLFEASSENDITRCVISTSSDTFENNDEEKNGFKELLSRKNGSNQNKESDICQQSDYQVRKEGYAEHQTIYVDNSRETILNKLGCELEDDSTESDNDRAIIIKTMQKPENIGNGTLKNKTENEHVDTTNENDGLGNLCHTKEGSKPQDSEIKTKQGAVSSTCYNRYNDFHNTIRQCTLANLPDNDSQEQFPAESDSNHFEAMHDSTVIPSLVDYKDSKIRYKVNNNVIAQNHDDNESKYLHLIDYDLAEHVSVINNNIESGHRESCSSKSNSNKGSESLFEVDNNLNIAAQESPSNYVHDYERERQLPDPSNPQRLHEKQTKHYASAASNNIPIDTGSFHHFDSDFSNGMQTGSKVKSLILNYELQVQENDSRHKLGEKYEEQSSKTSTTKSKSIKQTPNENKTHLKTDESYASYNSPFNKKKQPQVYNKTYSHLHKTESRSTDIINITNSTSNSIDNLHLATTGNSKSRLLHYEREKPPEIIGTTHEQSLQSSEYANDENNAEYRPNLKTKESFKNNLPGYNPIEESMNPGNLNDIEPKYENLYLNVGDIRRKSSALVAGSKNRRQNSTVHSQVTRAHWYDIQNPLQQPSRKIPPASSEGNTFTSAVNYNKRRDSGISGMRHKRWKSLGELDKMEQLEEYKLPEKISKTTASQENMSSKNNNLDTMYFDATPGNTAPYYTQRIHSDFNNDTFETLSPDFKPEQSSLLARRKHERNISGSTKTQKLGSKFENKNLKTLSPGTKMQTQSPLLARKHGRLTRYLKQEDDNPDCSSFQKTRSDYDDNLSSSLTALETLDQSPMKRSQKMKDLVNIEYYDINSDEELISKIKRRPRTRSLSEENKMTGYLVPRREFKSSGDLRPVGLTQDKVNSQSTSKRASSVDLVSDILSKEEQTHGKYAELHGTALHSSSQEFDKPNSGVRVPFQEKSLNAYDKQLKHSRGPTYTTAYGTLSKNKKTPYLTEQHYERTPFSASPSHKQSHNDHVPIGNTKNFKSNLKRLTNLPRISIAKANTTATHDEKDIEDISIKCSRYPIKDFHAKQGIYNIAKAEEEWKRRYGKLGYNKEQLHHATDKEFGKLFTHVERESTIRSSSNQSGLNIKEVEGKTSSPSLFNTNANGSKDEKGSTSKSESKEFATTLNQLSSYVLSGYKSELGHYPLLNQDKSEASVNKRRCHLDDEGDLAHVLGDSDKFPKLSMLVHALIRLREVYRIGECTKPLKEEHAINPWNAQLRDAIQNKPMNALKDLTARNRGVDVNVRSQPGSSALHRAAIEGDVGAIQVLIEHGADVNTRDRYGFQPVHSALRHHHYKAAMFLMDCGTDLMSYTSKRIQQFVSVKAIAKQYLRQTLKTPL